MAADKAMPSALRIARQATPKPVTEIAAEIGIPPWLVEPYGEYVAKVDLRARGARGARGALGALAGRPRARFVYPVCGDLRTMPGLAPNSAAERIDIDTERQVVGLA